MHHIRLGFCGLTPFAADIIRTLVEDATFVEILGATDATGDLAADFARSGADLIVASLDEHEMERQWRAALARQPPLAVLNLLDDCTRARLYALYPQRLLVEDLDEERLLRAVRRHLRALDDD